MIKFITSAIIAATFAVPASGQTMYGGGSGQQNGELGIVDQTTADFTVLGDPTTAMDEKGLTGLAFDVNGRLWGGVSVGSQNGSTRLIEINPVTGARIDLVGTINDGGTNLRIVDLALQPSSGILFGLELNGAIYTINKTTAEADLVGDPGVGDRGGIAFGPDGTFYLIPGGGGELWRIDPSTGATIGMATLLSDSACVDGLAVRPNDGALFATECDGREVLRIDPTNGDSDSIDPGDAEDDVADLAFQIQSLAPAPVLSAATLFLLFLAMLTVGMRRARASIG